MKGYYLFVLLVLALLPMLARARLLIANSDTKRVFYHSIGKSEYNELVDKETNLRYGECTLAGDYGEKLEASYYQSDYVPHYTHGGAAHLETASDSFRHCLEQYTNQKRDALADVGLTAVAMAEFLNELGVSYGLNAIPALEYAVNYIKTQIDVKERTNLLKVLDRNSLNANELFKKFFNHGDEYEEDVHFNPTSETKSYQQTNEHKKGTGSKGDEGTVYKEVKEDNPDESQGYEVEDEKKGKTSPISHDTKKFHVSHFLQKKKNANEEHGESSKGPPQLTKAEHYLLKKQKAGHL